MSLTYRTRQPDEDILHGVVRDHFETLRARIADREAIALGIAVLGIYALLSYYTSRRTREFGVRLALGATRARIVRLVVDYAIHIVLIGLLPGVLLASLGRATSSASWSGCIRTASRCGWSCPC